MQFLDKGDNCKDVFADSAYRSAEIEQMLTARGFRSRTACAEARSPHTEAAKAGEPREEPDPIAHRARVRSPQTASGGRLVRTIGIVRARAKIGLQNLAYNIRRLVTLDRMAAA